MDNRLSIARSGETCTIAESYPPAICHPAAGVVLSDKRLPKVNRFTIGFF